MACIALVVVTEFDIDRHLSIKHFFNELRHTFYLTNGTDFLLKVGTESFPSNYSNTVDLEINIIYVDRSQISKGTQMIYL